MEIGPRADRARKLRSDSGIAVLVEDGIGKVAVKRPALGTEKLCQLLLALEAPGDALGGVAALHVVVQHALRLAARRTLQQALPYLEFGSAERRINTHVLPLLTLLVTPLVSLEIVRTYEAGIALWTDKRPFATVRTQVFLEMGLLSETGIALWAYKLLLSTVRTQVSLEMASLVEAGVALWARKRLVPAVRAQMCLEIAESTKASLALWAGKRLLA